MRYFPYWILGKEMKLAKKSRIVSPTRSRGLQWEETPTTRSESEGNLSFIDLMSFLFGRIWAQEERLDGAALWANDGH